MIRALKINNFSEKQLLTLNWWSKPEYADCDAIICDGAVRSGKTLSMSLGFVFWASYRFRGAVFAICGKTITSLRRNVIAPLLENLRSVGFICTEKVSRNYVDITLLGNTNRFYYFGGRDESAASLIQGITLSGVFLDETALMPRSFVEQALARCSVSGSKMWFNCNPENPSHWFYREWICKTKEKRALYLHFTMDDNPSLSEKVKSRYKRLYSGAFYERYILGKWVASEGVVYPMFSSKKHIVSDLSRFSFERFVISCDYGTVNPSSFGLWGVSGNKCCRIREYYYSSKREGIPRTDEEHYQALEKLAEGFEISKVIVDPSAASFIECIRRHRKFHVVKADNDVLTGIRRVSAALRQDRLFFSEECRDIIREFSLYCWNDKAAGDSPVKENDHAMDDMRYFVSDLIASENGDDFFALSITR